MPKWVVCVKGKHVGKLGYVYSDYGDGPLSIRWGEGYNLVDGRITHSSNQAANKLRDATAEELEAHFRDHPSDRNKLNFTERLEDRKKQHAIAEKYEDKFPYFTDKHGNTINFWFSVCREKDGVFYLRDNEDGQRIGEFGSTYDLYKFVGSQHFIDGSIDEFATIMEEQELDGKF